MAADTTTTLSGEMMTFLIDKFLERSKARIVHGEGAKKRVHPRNSGKAMTWNRYTPLAVATTALTEATNPSEANLTGNTVTATVAEYGNFVKISSLLYGTSIDKEASEKTEVLAQNASETLDTLIRNELASGATTQFAAGRAALSAITSADLLTSTEIRKAVKTLKKNNALTYEDGYFIGKLGPDTSYNLQGDSTTWINVHNYNDPSNIYKGEVGKLFGVRFIEASSNQYNESSTVTVYSNFIHGKEAFGTVDLSGDNMKLIVKQSDKSDTSNALNMFMTIGWKATFATKTLNSSWIVNVKTAA
jgi:N4-gp56 family major capsid protein